MYCVYEIHLGDPITSKEGNRPVAAFVIDEDADKYIRMMEERYPGLHYVKTRFRYRHLTDGTES